MANIQEYLAQILAARYGKDVRQSIHDSIDEINKINEANIVTVREIADEAQGYATSASSSASTATQAVTDAQTAKTGAETAQSNAETAEDNAEYWYNQAKTVAEGLSGALIPMGTVTFANLPSLSDASEGWMYNISDEFTTTSDFVEGAGKTIPLGSNVYKTNGGKWDILAGSPVTGIKGDAESTYRRGNVNITKANIGLGNVDNTSDADKPISTATQNAIDEVKGLVDDTRYVEVQSNGVKTNRQLLNELYSLIDMSKVTTRSKLLLMRPDVTTVYPVMLLSSTMGIQCGHIQFNTPTISITIAILNETSSSEVDGGVNDINSPTVYGNNITLSVPSSGLTIRFVY